MATALAPVAVREHDAAGLPQGASSNGGPPPVLFLYNHLHDAIRSELDALSSAVLSLDASQEASGGGGGVDATLLRLKDRYRFLEQVYKYHSSVEDEVSAPWGLCGCNAGPRAWRGEIQPHGPCVARPRRAWRARAARALPGVPAHGP
jgi:hypothetical protein